MSVTITAPSLTSVKSKRIYSIDLLRGTVILIMALDHVRDYFHSAAFEFNPTDLTHTNTTLFFTRWITHFCAPVFSLLHQQNFFPMGHFSIMMGYPVLPWIGIMLTGYGFGKLYIPSFDAAKRKKILIYLGVGAIALFIILRAINVYGDRSHWSVQA